MSFYDPVHVFKPREPHIFPFHPTFWLKDPYRTEAQLQQQAFKQVEQVSKSIATPVMSAS